MEALIDEILTTKDKSRVPELERLIKADKDIVPNAKRIVPLIAKYYCDMLDGDTKSTVRTKLDQLLDRNRRLSAGDLDLLWMHFAATKDSKFAERVLFEATASNDIDIAGAAQWSYNSHVQQGKYVPSLSHTEFLHISMLASHLYEFVQTKSFETFADYSRIHSDWGYTSDKPQVFACQLFCLLACRRFPLYAPQSLKDAVSNINIPVDQIIRQYRSPLPHNADVGKIIIKWAVACAVQDSFLDETIANFREIDASPKTGEDIKYRRGLIDWIVRLVDGKDRM